MALETVGGTGEPEPVTLPIPGWVARRSNLALGASLVAVAALVRTIIWHRTAVLMNDGPIFLGLAESISEGHWREALAHKYHPLYPMFTAAFHAVFDDWETAAVAVSIVAGGLAAGFLFDFLLRAFDRSVACVGTLLFAIHPYAAQFSSDVQSEGLYMAFFLGSVAFTWRMLTLGKVSQAAIAGLLGGLAYLTRPEGGGVLIVAFLGLLVLGLRRRWNPGRVLSRGAAMAIAALLVAGPYVAFMQQDAGELRLTRKKNAVEILTLHDRGKGKATSAPAETGAAGRGQAFLEAADDLGASVRHGFRPEHLLIGSLGVAAVGLLPGVRGAFLLALVGLYAFVLLGLHLTAGYVSMRHVLPPLLPLLGYVALGIPTFGRIVLALPARLAGRWPPRRSTAFAVGLAMMVTASTLMATRPQRVERLAAREAAEWLADQGGVDRVAGSKGRDGYYAGATYVPLPKKRGGWVERLIRGKVRWVIVDEGTRKRYPGLAAEAQDPRLRLAYHAEARGREAWVFEIVGAGSSGSKPVGVEPPGIETPGINTPGINTPGINKVGAQ